MCLCHTFIVHCEISKAEDEDEECLYRPAMKLQFLDVDGVLHRPSTTWDVFPRGLDRKLLKYLNLNVSTHNLDILTLDSRAWWQ